MMTKNQFDYIYNYFIQALKNEKWTPLPTRGELKVFMNAVSKDWPTHDCREYAFRLTVGFLALVNQDNSVDEPDPPGVIREATP